MIAFSKKWNINSEMGFIDVSIDFFIGLKIISQTIHEIQSYFNLVHIETDQGTFIVENGDWEEIQSELRNIKIEQIVKN